MKRFDKNCEIDFSQLNQQFDFSILFNSSADLWLMRQLEKKHIKEPEVNFNCETDFIE